MSESEAPGRAATLWRRVRPVLAAAAQRGRRLVERVLHPLRRRTARDRLTRLPAVESILVLCYGNICRSPYAASVLTQTLMERGRTAQVTQGGFLGPDRPANERALTVARGRGIDLGGHRSRLVTADEARNADLVIVMERQQAERVIHQYGSREERVLLLGDLDPGAIETRDIPDPYGLDTGFFARTYERIDRCIAELVRALDRDRG